MNPVLLATESFSHRGKHFFLDFKRAANNSKYLNIACVQEQQGQASRRFSIRVFEENLPCFIEAMSSLFLTAAYRQEQLDRQSSFFKTTERTTGIKSWEPECRPREKLMEQGRGAMADEELLAMLIGSGLPGVTAVDLAARVLNSVDHDLKRLSRLSAGDLMAFPGIGHAKALSIISAMELAARLSASEQPQHFLKVITQ